MRNIIKGVDDALSGGKVSQSMIAQVIIMKWYVGGIISSKQNEYYLGKSSADTLKNKAKHILKANKDEQD